MLACAFEGTNVSVGRGTENNFKFTAPLFANKSNFSFVPKPWEHTKIQFTME
jgi:hypothetical protein